MVTSALLLSILSFVLAAGQSDDTTFANPTIAIASHCSGSSLRSSSQSLPDSDYSSARNGNVSVEPETDDSCRSRFLRGADLAADPRTARAGYDSLKAMLSDCRSTNYACAPFGAMAGAINRQFWSTGSSGTGYSFSGTSDALLANVTYNSNPATDGGWNVRTGSLSCGGGSVGTIRTGPGITAKPEFDTDDCLAKYRWADKNVSSIPSAQQVYDTVRAFIEACAMYEWSYNAFGMSSEAVSFLTPHNERYLEYRNWLKSVLYLNRTDQYYCADVGAIYQTFVHYIGPQGHDYNAEISVLDYIAHCGRCDSASYWDSRQDLRREQWLHYRDTVRDSVTYPLDTTLPSLQDLGLGLLGVGERTAGPAGYIRNLSLTPNPATDATTLSFELADIDVAQVEIFDLPGNAVLKVERTVYEMGLHEIPIAGASWPAGTYYVRLTTAHGATQTAKLVKR